MVLQQAEIYFERLVADPVSLVRRLFDRGLDLARRIKAQNFADVPTVSTYALEQNDGFPHLVVPLTGRRNIELSIYAKTNRRVRFEVRFQRDFGSVLRGQSTGDDRLGALLERLTRDAERRLPWRALSRAATAPPEVNVGDVPELISRLVKATRRNASLFDPLVRQLVITGGVIADDERQPGIERAVRALVRDGVLEHWTVQLKEQKSSRRYGLTHRFAEVRLKMLSGFLPQDSSVASHDWQTHVSPDHFEASANIAGGQHMVERPLDTRRVARRPDWS
jgi:hypothetical protein